MSISVPERRKPGAFLLLLSSILRCTYFRRFKISDGFTSGNFFLFATKIVPFFLQVIQKLVKCLGCNVVGDNDFQNLQNFWLLKELLNPYLFRKSLSL